MTTPDKETAPPSEEAQPSVIPPNPQFIIPIHTLIESQQRSHGLLQNDHAQYRKYCTRRLSRLRHAQAVKSSLVHSGGKGGSKHAFTARNYAIEESVEHENYLLVALWKAERAWSHAMETKAQYDEMEDNGKGKAKVRQMYMKKLRKAVKHGEDLSGMSNLAGSEGTKVEAEAYLAWMRGNLALETGDWQMAVTEYNQAFTICKGLGDGTAIVSEDREDVASSLETQDYFTTRAEHVIDPVLRYCRYELAEGGMKEEDIFSLLQNNNDIETNSTLFNLQSKLHTLQTQTLKSQAQQNITQTIKFRNHTIPIQNEKLRIAMLHMDNQAHLFQKDDIHNDHDKKWIHLLTSIDDAHSIAADELKNVQKLKPGPAVNQKLIQIQLLCQYLQYQKLFRLMARNERLADHLHQAPNPHWDEMTHLYDVLLQNARTIADWDNHPSDVEDEFALEAKAHVLRFRAWRCYTMGIIFSSTSEDKKKGLALLEHASSLAKTAEEELGACDAVSNEIVEGMEELQRQIMGLKCRVKAEIFIMSRRKDGLDECSRKSLLHRLGDFDAGNPAEKYNLVDVPKRLEYVPARPSFFDIALNHVGEMPDEMLQKHIDEYEKGGAKGGGILGWFRRG